MSFLNFIKKHKIGVIFFVVVAIIVGAMFSFARSVLVSGNEGTIYGKRLNGIKDVKLNEDTLNKITTEIKASEQVKTASHRLEGKILNITIDVVPEMTLEVAHQLVGPILNSLTEKELGFYDIQVLIICSANEASELYPVIGYKHRTSSEFVW